MVGVLDFFALASIRSIGFRFIVCDEGTEGCSMVLLLEGVRGMSFTTTWLLEEAPDCPEFLNLNLLCYSHLIFL